MAEDGVTVGARGRTRAGSRIAIALVAFGLGGGFADAPDLGADRPNADDIPLVVTLGPDGRDLRLSGDFLEGSAERVRAALVEHPTITRVHLTSDGGLVDESRAVGELIAARGLITYVPDVCVSACTLAFVRGRERLLMQGARLGFHAPFETDDEGREVQVDGSEEERAYVAAGVEAAFAHEAIGTPSRSLWIPSADRLIAARVVTAVVESGDLPDSTLDEEPTFAGARRAVLRNVPMLRAAATTAPDLVDDVAAWYLDGYRRGRSEGEAIAGLQSRADRIARAAFARSGDQTVETLAKLVADALAVADPERCAAMGGSPRLVASDAALSGSASRPGPISDLLAQRLGEGAAGPRLDVDASPEPAPLGPMQDCTALRRRIETALASADDPTLRALVLGPTATDRPRLEASASPRHR